MKATGTKKILVIDDEKDIREFFRDFFEERGYEVTLGIHGQDGLEKFQKDIYDLVLCDVLMPKMTGIELLRLIKEAKPQQKIIMLTGVKERSMIEKAKKLGCLHYITKPITLEDLDEKVAESLGSSG